MSFIETEQLPALADSIASTFNDVFQSELGPEKYRVKELPPYRDVDKYIQAGKEMKEQYGVLWKIFINGSLNGRVLLTCSEENSIENIFKGSYLNITSKSLINLLERYETKEEITPLIGTPNRIEPGVIKQGELPLFARLRVINKENHHEIILNVGMNLHIQSFMTSLVRKHIAYDHLTKKILFAQESEYIETRKRKFKFDLMKSRLHHNGSLLRLVYYYMNSKF